MKIKGRSRFDYHFQVDLNVPGERDVIRLRMKSVPFGLEIQVQQDLPDPTPPTKWIHKGRNRERYHDEHDEGYRLAILETNLLQAAMMFYLSVDDPEVSFDSKEEDFETKRAFWGAIANEIKEAGITGPMLLSVARQIQDHNVVNEGEASKEAELVFTDRGSEQSPDSSTGSIASASDSDSAKESSSSSPTESNTERSSGS